MAKRKNKNLIFGILGLVVIAIIVTIIIVVINNNKYSFKLQEITESDAKYFLLAENDKYGVIDSDGKAIIDAQYNQLIIPNPTEPVFLCTNVATSDATYKAVNAKNEQLYTDCTSVKAIALKSITSLVPYEKTVLVYQNGNMYGIMDYQGDKITEAIYEDISNIDYKEGYLKVKKEGLYGVINIKGTQILDFDYDSVLSDGYYDEESKYENAGLVLRVRTDDGYKFGYATTNGKIIVDPVYNELTRITEIQDKNNVYLITSNNGKYGLLKNSKEVLPNEYQNITYDKTNKFLVVEKGQTKGVLDLDGKNIVPLDYDNIIIGGSYINASKGEQLVIFDNKGNTLNTDITSYDKVNDNYAIVIDKDNTYNIMDKSGKEVLKEKYAYIEYFTANYFIVTSNAKAGIINSDGKVIIPIEYDTIQKVSAAECLQATTMENDKKSIIDVNAKIHEGIEKSNIVTKNNYIKLYSDNDMKYYDLKGNETTYKELFPNNSVYAFKQNDKWGFKDKEGKVVVECKYEMVSEQNGNYVGVKQNGKWGVLDISGKQIIEPKYSITWNDVIFLGKYYGITSSLGLPIYCGDEKI